MQLRYWPVALLASVLALCYVVFVQQAFIIGYLKTVTGTGKSKKFPCSQVFYKTVDQFTLKDPFLIQDSSECGGLKEFLSNKPKVRVMSAHVMKPELVRLQKRSLDLFLEDEFEYVVYGGDAPSTVAAENNMWNPSVNDEVELAARKLGVEFRKIPSHLHQHRECIFPHTRTERSTLYPTQNSRSSDAIQFMFRDAINFCSKDLIVILDADMILIKNISFRRLLGKHNAAGLEHSRSDSSTGATLSLRYLFTGPTIFNMVDLPKKDVVNFDWGHHVYQIHGHTHKLEVFLDTAGFTNEWLLQANPSILWLDRDPSDNHDRLAKIWTERVTAKYPLLTSSNFEYYANKSVLHLRNGSNWKKLGALYNTSALHEFEAIDFFFSMISP